jgi:dienelactone hydrolase
MPANVAAVIARAEGIPQAALAVKTNAQRVSAGAAEEGSFPVVLFSPGFGESHSLYTALLEDLASHGFVVIALDHTHETAAVQLPGGVVAQTINFDPRDQALKRRILRAREDDVEAVIEKLSALRAARRLPRSADLTRVGMFGHSLGGRTAVDLLRRRSRLACAADLDGSLRDLSSQPPVTRPLLIVSGAEGTPLIRGFWASIRGQRWWFELVGAAHLDFTDWVWLAPALTRIGHKPGSAVDAGGVSPARAVSAERYYDAAFFSTCLKGASRAPLRRPPAVGLIPHQ